MLDALSDVIGALSSNSALFIESYVSYPMDHLPLLMYPLLAAPSCSFDCIHQCHSHTPSGKMTLGDKRLQACVVAASTAGSCGRRWSHTGQMLNLVPHIRWGRELTLACRTGEMSYKMRSVPCIHLQDQGVTL